MKTLLDKKLVIAFTAVVICIVISTANAQNTFPSTGAVGIGTTTPNASSLLEIKSTTKGMLMPRMTLAQRNTIATPATGLLIYQTNSTPGYYYYNGTAWAAVSTKGANTSLSNLVATSINQSLVPNLNGVFRLGQRTLRWDSAYLNGLVFGNGSIQTVAFIPYTAGTGISIGGTTITNSAPDKTVVLSNGTGISVTGTYPNFTVTNSAPDKTVSLTAGTGISITGTYPNFTIASTGGSGGGWSLTGNAGTTPGTNFLGTTDAKALMFKVNNTNAGYIDYDAALGNTSLGYASLISNSTGNSNTAEGYHALYANSTGHDNTANGGSALFKNTTGSNNTADGAGTLYNNINGYSNVALGKFALYSNTNGYHNTATGDSALFSNNTGINNTANGYEALYLNQTGVNNTGIGEGALNVNLNGSNNSAHGAGALDNNIDGNWNTATGAYAMYYNTHGVANTATGGYALQNNLTGVSNVANGYGALMNATGSYNTGTGSYALYAVSGSNNTANGYEALFANTTGTNNTASGFEAAWSNTKGYGNVAIGTAALFYNNSLSNLVAIGDSAMYNTISNDEGGTPSGNTAVGSKTLFSNTGGSNNTANGYQALYSNQDGTYNTATGYQSLYSNQGNVSNQSGFYNTANGYQALWANTTGSNNVAVGDDALLSNTTGGGNVAIGQNALVNNSSGNDNTALGQDAGFSTPSNVNNSTSIGAGAEALVSNQMWLGNTSVTSIMAASNFTIMSDARFKRNIKENVPGLAFINLLKPSTYNYNIHSFNKMITSQDVADKSLENSELQKLKEDAIVAKEKITYTGFVAQDVEAAAKKIGYDFSGIHKPQNDKDIYGLSYSDFVVPLVKAVQELSKMNDAKDAKIDTLQNQLNELRTLVLSIQQKQESCSPCSASANSAAQTQSYTVLTDGASLQQNIPNPFTNTTSIGYILPQKFTNAQIIITDKMGKTLKIVNVSGNGKGSLNVDASTLSSGAYQYSLIVDGRLIAAKQMLLTK